MCSTYNAVGNFITTDPETVKLGTIGVYYFICIVDRQCFEGQKLSVTVSTSTPGGAMPPSSNTAQPPSDDDACAPTPANSLSSSLSVVDLHRLWLLPPPPHWWQPFMLLCPSLLWACCFRSCWFTFDLFSFFFLDW